VTETVGHTAVRANAFRERTNLSVTQSDANERASHPHKCHVLNSYFKGATLRTPLGFKENACEELWGESVWLSVLHSKYPVQVVILKHFRFHFSYSSKRCYSKLHNCPSNYTKK